MKKIKEPTIKNPAQKSRARSMLPWALAILSIPAFAQFLMSQQILKVEQIEKKARSDAVCRYDRIHLSNNDILHLCDSSYPDVIIKNGAEHYIKRITDRSEINVGDKIYNNGLVYEKINLQNSKVGTFQVADYTIRDINGGTVTVITMELDNGKRYTVKADDNLDMLNINKGDKITLYNVFGTDIFERAGR